MILGVAVAVCTVLRTLIPMGVLPKLDIPNMVLLSLAALLVDHYMGKSTGKGKLLSAIPAGLSFGLLPYAAGFCVPMEAVKAGLVGAAVFALTALLYGSVQERLASGPKAKAAPVLSALGLYLAAQCFAGMLL